MSLFISKMVYYLSGAIVGYFLGKIDAPVWLLVLELACCMSLMYAFSMLLGLI